MGFIEVLIIIIFLLILIFFLWLLGIYNKLYFYLNKVEDKYETLDKEITNISNICDKVIDYVKEQYGEDKIQDVKIVNRNLQGSVSPNERMHKVVGVLKFLNFVKDHLEDNDELKKYEVELISSLDNIQYATEFYNTCVSEYNEYRSKKVAYYIFRLFKFKEYNKCNIIENANRI